MAETRPLPDFVEALASGASTPGGGAAAAVVGALAAALAEMVANFTVGRPKFAAVDASMRRAVERASMLRERLLALTEDDEQAFTAVSAAFKLPKGSEDERTARNTAIQAALHAAMRPPLEVMRLGCDVLELASEVAASGNASVVSDAGCAALMGEAAVRAAALNVLANVVLLHDAAAAHDGSEAVVQLEERAAALRERTMAAVHTRLHGQTPS
jgi:glutamate formiminotransferase/formiminotetrahydrofolate cyclodeaminase